MSREVLNSEMTTKPTIRTSQALRPRRVADTTPDLQTQLEGLFDAVWEAEANWRFDDRLDTALKLRRATH